MQAFVPNEQASSWPSACLVALKTAESGKPKGAGQTEKTPAFWLNRNPRFFTYGKSVFIDCAGLGGQSAAGQASLLGLVAGVVLENLPRAEKLREMARQSVPEARLTLGMHQKETQKTD
jgi:hypothetical protein